MEKAKLDWKQFQFRQGRGGRAMILAKQKTLRPIRLAQVGEWDWNTDKKEDGRSPTEVESERPSLLLWRQEIEAKASRPE